MKDFENQFWKLDIESYYQAIHWLKITSSERLKQHLKDKIKKIEEKYPNVNWEMERKL